MSEESKPDHLMITLSSDDEPPSTPNSRKERMVKLFTISVVSVIVFLAYADATMSLLLDWEDIPECKAVFDVGKNLFFNQFVLLIFLFCLILFAIRLVAARKMDVVNMVEATVGAVFLTLSIVCVVRKVSGLVSCGSQYAVRAFGALFCCTAFLILIGYLVRAVRAKITITPCLDQCCFSIRSRHKA